MIAQRTPIAVPPHGRPQMRCDLWPDCMCDGDCDEQGPVPTLTEQQRILFIVLFVIGAVGTGLIWLALR